ncbi:unnamed protein product [Leuciscus chuanchicus]
MLKVLWITLAILWIIKNGTALTPLQPDVTKGALLTYSRDELLRLRSSILCNEKPADIPPEIRPRKRGSRGGGERLFRDACIIALTESWLDESISDSEINLDNFLTVRADRTRQSGKERGGGLCVFINKRWCTNIKIHSIICTPDVEILTLSLRPFYLPREFPTVIFGCVYCPPDANIQAAAELIAENANSMLSKYPRAPVFYMGDYNNCSLDSVLPSFHQYVHCPTRKGNVLDLCYGNVLDAFTVRAHPPLGSSDHNVLVFLPGYRQELKRIKPQVHSAPQFDITDYSAVCNELLNALPSDLPTTPPFTEVDVRQELSRCKIGKAMGPDGIPARVLKLCAMELSPVLYSIMHESYNNEMQKLQDILTSADVQGTSKYPSTSTSWCLRQSVAQDEWQKARSCHINCLLSCNVAPEKNCSHCTSPAVIHCRDCMPQEWLWTECPNTQKNCRDPHDTIIKMALIKEESEEMKIEETLRVKQEDTEDQTDLMTLKEESELVRGDTEAFPGQPGDTVSPACPRSSPGSPPSGTRPEHLPGKASRRHPEQMPEPPQLTPLDVEEQRLYSELLQSDRASHPISKGSPSHPAEKAHFGRLYPGSCPFGHDPKLMTIGLEEDHHHLEQKLWGYACRQYFMTPFPDPNPGPQTRYNAALERTRARIEMTFGQLKERFQCLKGLRVAPDRACDIIVACAILHNIATIRKERAPVVEVQPDDDLQPVHLDQPSGRAARDRIVEHHF